jgi:hypothetical protein
MLARLVIVDADAVTVRLVNNALRRLTPVTPRMTILCERCGQRGQNGVEDAYGRAVRRRREKYPRL